jgi:signal peptidase I
MKTLRISSIFSNLLLLITLVGTWMAFAPVSLKGKTSYVIVNGISMEPGFHLGDLTIMRQTATYQVGDVVTYYDSQMNAYVIHRIIAENSGQYVLKGDNNSWVDAYYPTNEEIIGKLWFHIPKLGKIFKWLRVPFNMALSLGLLGGILMSGMIIKPSKAGKSRTSPAPNLGSSPESGLYVFGFSTLLFLGLSIVVFLRPLTRTADQIQFTQQGQFTYSATGAPIIYDTNMVRSGEPIFPRLSCFLNIGFAYTIPGSNLQDISGNYQLNARVMDQQTGWQRTIPMGSVTTFSGNSFSTTSTLDVCQIVALVQVLEQETGLRAGNYMLEVIPQVTMTASAAGVPISNTFEPRLAFKFNDVSFALLTPDGQTDPLASFKEQSIANPSVETNTISILGWNPSVLSLRLIGLLGLAISFSGLLFFGLRMYTTAQQNPEALIRLRYGSLMVNASEQKIRVRGSLINVDSIDELAKLAERHNTVILHTTFNSMHAYQVQCNETTYRYTSRLNRSDTYDIEPVSSEITRPVYTIRQDKLLENDADENELIGYVLSKRRVEKAEVHETIVLRKIRL